jgi:hypothetical protein
MIQRPLEETFYVTLLKMNSVALDGALSVSYTYVRLLKLSWHQLRDIDFRGLVCVESIVIIKLTAAFRSCYSRLNGPRGIRLRWVLRTTGVPVNHKYQGEYEIQRSLTCTPLKVSSTASC